MEERELVYLSIGSNLGDRLQNIKDAIRFIQRDIGTIENISPVYEAPPLGFESSDFFLNLCIAIRTVLSPNDILTASQEIEKELGRIKKSTNGYSSRIIDIDIILYGNQEMTSEYLTIPHPLFRERNFVLQPLNDLDKDLTDPITMLTIEQLKKNCKDQSKLERLQIKIDH